MLNIPELEKKWLRYKIKSLLPYFAALVLFFIGAISGFYYVFHTKNDSKQPLEKKQKTPSTTKLKQQIHNSVQPTKETTPHTQKRVLQPSMNFLHTIQENSSKISYHEQKKYSKHATPAPATPQTIYKKTPPHTQKEKEKEQQQYTQKNIVDTNQITIKRRDTKNDIKEIIRRFKKNHNPALSLFVAKKYYELGEYKNAYNYALITNQINEDIEESWIIFAKSLVKLNQKQKAIKTLQEYVIFSHSSTAQILLHEIQSGKFQ